MVSTLPTPVAAALGVVPTVLDSVKRLPAKAVSLPLHAVGAGLTQVGRAKKAYDDLADRGEALVGRLRGEAEELYDDVVDRADDLEDRLEDLLSGTPVAGLYDTVEDALEDAVDKAKETAGTVQDKAVAAKDVAERTGTSLADELQQELAAVPEAEQPKGEATPKAPTGSPDKVDTAASPEVVAVVEQVVEEVTAAAPAAPVVAHDDLPLADYDHMTLGSLRGRLRSLSVEDLVVVRDYEKAHADRLPVVTMLDNRLARLATDASATPSPGKGEAPKKPAAAKKAKVTPATAATPSGAPVGAQPGLPLN